MLRIAFVLIGALACTEPTPAPTTVGDPAKAGIPTATPEEVGIDLDALAQMETHAVASHSGALLVVKDGLLVYSNYFGQRRHPTPVMSASKSFVNLAVGYLIDEGALSLSRSAADFIPAWQTDPVKSTITIRHLLDHTSGLDPARAFDPETGPGALESHLAQTPMVAMPGEKWAYNNNAVDALALVAERAAGTTLDTYLGERLFDAVDAKRPYWMRFADGAPMGAGELVIDPMDLAKVGRALTDPEQQVTPPGWLTTSLESTPFQANCGLLWWKNMKFDVWGVPSGPVKGFFANGWLGQYLFLYPEQRLVVVRVHYPTELDYSSSSPDTEFFELPDDALALVGESL
jgi:CubicO group peptidase (beta-lactamase class C family)